MATDGADCAEVDGAVNAALERKERGCPCSDSTGVSYYDRVKCVRRWSIGLGERLGARVRYSTRTPKAVVIGHHQV